MFAIKLLEITSLFIKVKLLEFYKNDTKILFSIPYVIVYHIICTPFKRVLHQSKIYISEI